MKLLTFDQQDQQLHIAQNNITQLWPRNMNLLGLILKNKQKKNIYSRAFYWDDHDNLTYTKMYNTKKIKDKTKKGAQKKNHIK